MEKPSMTKCIISWSQSRNRRQEQHTFYVQHYKTISLNLGLRYKINFQHKQVIPLQNKRKNSASKYEP